MTNARVESLGDYPMAAAVANRRTEAACRRTGRAREPGADGNEREIGERESLYEA